MLDEEFLHGLDAAFPHAFERARHHVDADRDQLLKLAGSREERARLLARPYGAALLWWPYLRASTPFAANPVPAHETVVRIVLLVDRLHGWEPSEPEAREQVRRVLQHAFDPLELKAMWEKQTGEGGRLAFAAPVLTPLVTPLLTPGGWLGLARKAPFALAWSLAIVTATLATIPVVTGWSIASRADRDARVAPRHVDMHVVEPEPRASSLPPSTRTAPPAPVDDEPAKGSSRPPGAGKPGGKPGPA